MISTATPAAKDAVTTGGSSALAHTQKTGLAAWDPFQLMDRLDEIALMAEMEGISRDELVYVIKDGAGKETEGLSKGGVDECCRACALQGQVIRELEMTHSIIGDGTEREALFTVRAARFAVNPAGGEVMLDQVLGVKRQPFYTPRVPLTLDSWVPGKKWSGRTYRDVLGDEDGRKYLKWVAENFREESIREFVRAVLDGEDVGEFAQPDAFNPHWFEHGAMKAARNARFRLIPLNIRARVMALAKKEGKVKVVEVAKPETSAKPNENGDATKADALALPPENERTLEWARGVPLLGHKDNWGGHGTKPLGEVPRKLLEKALKFFEAKLQDEPDQERLRIQVIAIKLLLAEPAPAETKAEATPAPGGKVPAPGSVEGAIAPDSVAAYHARIRILLTSPTITPEVRADIKRRLVKHSMKHAKLAEIEAELKTLIEDTKERMEDDELNDLAFWR